MSEERRSFDVTFTAVNHDVLAALFGPQTYAVTFDQEIQVPAPTRPPHKRGFIAWLTRANVKAEREWAARYTEWQASDKRETLRLYIPNATLAEVDHPEADQ